MKIKNAFLLMALMSIGGGAFATVCPNDIEDAAHKICSSTQPTLSEVKEAAISLALCNSTKSTVAIAGAGLDYKYTSDKVKEGTLKITKSTQKCQVNPDNTCSEDKQNNTEKYYWYIRDTSACPFSGITF